MFKDEINIVGNIVDKFNLSNEEKSNLFNNIILYWRYSIKENKWSIERERRYQIFLWEDYEYVDLENDEKFLKVNTYLTIVKYILPFLFFYVIIYKVKKGKR